MISAHELRIGNYYNQFGNVQKVTAFAISELVIAPKEQLWCKPITLTEEWLARFEFESVDDKIYSIKPRLSICPDAYIIRTGNVWKIQLGNETLSMPHVKYVHQLQNLYFALVGEELKLIEDATV